MFNEEKTVYIMWGKDDEPNKSIVFGNQILQPKIECKHMGVKINSESSKISHDIVLARKAKTALYAARGIGSQMIPC